ncbi:Hypothetical predicted protein [Xyrichtys novacula]|uniref:Uncharacterized protein n=1 Tax=Xyrichtys novacula TaxID=13765 RepID=A0AAV1EZW3_XYRNO|nr:Hypothetical predicted protein [Xyrichtys novacula]
MFPTFKPVQTNPRKPDKAAINLSSPPEFSESPTAQTLRLFVCFLRDGEVVLLDVSCSFIIGDKITHLHSWFWFWSSNDTNTQTEPSRVLTWFRQVNKPALMPAPQVSRGGRGFTYKADCGFDFVVFEEFQESADETTS